jgi:O-antigen ligase/predicted Zn-dependent protease
VATPLAVGGVEPWAYAAVEELVFILLALWMARGVIGGDEIAESDRLAARRSGFLALPATLLIGIIAFQMVPLPPKLERLLSPATFEMYQRSLPGWPDNPPAYQTRLERHRAPDAIVVLPTADEVAAGVPIAFNNSRLSDYESHQLNKTAQSQSKPTIGVWRTLSISPALTEPALLKLLAYAGLFLLVAAYPFRGDTHAHFCRWLAQVVLLAGLMTASLALIERVYSNGQALWLLMPYDWQGRNPWGDRAVGSFANPDHLANYLAQTLPIAVVGVFWPAALSRQRPQVMRAFAGGALVLISSALLLTSSRGGWLGALMSMVVLGTLWPRGDGGARRRVPGKIFIVVSLGLFLILLMFVGPGGRAQADARLKETIANKSLVGREGSALATITMVRDFPVFGIGLGCWPEIFPRYARPPWTSVFWNATHNDYVQVAAEMGLVGFALLAWFLIRIWRRIYEGKRAMKPGTDLLVAAALAAASGTAVHEFFDFPLQVPANALLLTALLGLAVRLTGDKGAALSRSRRPLNRGLLYGIGLLAALGLLPATLAQKRTPYPYNLQRPANIAQAYALIDAHPAHAAAHVSLARMLAEMVPPGDVLKELRAAVWLDPTNPYFRDLYAQALLEQNKAAVALDEIARSVSNAPDLAMHFYLTPRIVPWLPEAERKAIGAGFNSAVDHHYPGAVENFARYDDELGDTNSEAELFAAAAESAGDEARRAAFLSSAGMAYFNAGEPRQAEAAWRSAIAAAPADSEPYAKLIDGIFAPAKDWLAANLLIAQGIEQGADPVLLYQALAQAALSAGDYVAARDALQKALAARPADFATILQMGLLDLTDHHPDRAATWFRRAAELRPDSPEAFSDLGRAEEIAYEYFAADRAYSRAVAIAPGDAGLQKQYAAFRHRVAENSKPLHH